MNTPLLRHLATGLVVVIVAACAVLFGGVQTQVLQPAIALLAIIAVACLTPVLAAKTSLPADPILAAFAALWLVAAALLPLSASTFLSADWLLRLAAYLCVYGVLAHVTPSSRAARWLLSVLIAVAFLAALYGMFVTLSGREVVLWAKKEWYRDSLTGTFINRSHFASYLALHLYAAIGLAAASRRHVRLGLLLAVAGGLLALGLTLSRGGLLAAAAALPILLWSLGDRYRRVAVPLAAAGGIAFCALLATNWDRLHQRIEASFSADGEPSAAARLSIWRSTTAAFAAHPVVGHGAGTFISFYPRYREPGISRKVDYAHSDYLEQAAELGLIGVLAALLGAAAIVTSLRRALLGAGEQRPVVAGLAAGVAVVALHASIDFPLKIPAIAMAVAAALGLAVAVSGRARPRLGAGPSRVLATIAAIALLAIAVRSVQVYRADRHLRRGDALFAKPAWDAAATEFAAATVLDPLNPRGWEWLARTEANRAKFRVRDGMDARRDFAAAALEHLAEAERLNHASADYNLQRAWMLNFLGRRDEAAAEYDLAVADDPQNTNVLFHAGSFHLVWASKERGLELMGQAIRSWPNFFGGRVAEIHHRVKDVELVLGIIPSDRPFLMFQYAVHLLSRADEPEAARRAFDAAAANGGWRNDWIIPFGGLIAQHQSAEAAIEFYRSLPVAAQSAPIELEVGKLHLAAGRHAAALGSLADGVARFPADRELLRFFIEHAGDTPATRGAIDRYREASGEDVGYLVARATLALAGGDSTAAIEAFEAALTLSPSDERAVGGLKRSLDAEARAARERGDLQTAERCEAKLERMESRR